MAQPGERIIVPPPSAILQLLLVYWASGRPAAEVSRFLERPSRILRHTLQAVRMLSCHYGGIRRRSMRLQSFAMLAASFLPWIALGQAVTPPTIAPGQTLLTVTLTDALARARQFGLQVQGANITAQLAKEDRVQARAATLPSVNGFNQFIYTEGNGTPSGVFVANDGVHIYNEQIQVHEELLAIARRGELRRAQAAEASARARVEVAARGLNATVVQSYYGLVAAQRRLINAQTSLREAEQFVDITQKQERGGEVAHADVIKAQLQLQQRQRDLSEAQLAIDKAKVALAVLIFPQFRDDFVVEDDLSTIQPLAPLPDIQAQATGNSPDLKAAQLSLREAGLGVSVARYAYLPSFALDFYYGINANQFAAHTDYPTQDTGRSTLPNYLVPGRQNLGYSGQVTLNIPLWTWGATQSKVRQATLRQRQAEFDLSQTQRQLRANIESFYLEARTSQLQVDSLRSSSALAAESLRLTVLRYRAGEATALEVADAQTTVVQARNAYDDGLARYRVALANLQTLTGTF
jgi:outer membrane protein TolC